ncbi:MAG TPA: T9SS type A sorting domain-containing protein [Bacteroidia bacterium]|nr:T9SS type A sorting domain-containing protein [Bacteroidia bacterium]
MRKFYPPVFLLFLFISPFASYAQTGIPCNPNTFFAIKNNGIEEFLITGGIITSNGLVATGVPPNQSLAYCDNLNGALFSPTFYANDGSSAAYYDGTSWITTTATSNCMLSNAGGYGNYLYYNWFNLSPSCLDRYDGISFTQIWSDSLLVFTVADLAIDASGNAWTFAGNAAPNTEFIQVVSPAGTLIKSFPFNLNTNNGYGCFLLNGILYLGLGGGNPGNPNTLIPITFTSDSAFAGTPIPFTSGPDLASCNPGTPLAVTSPSAPGHFGFEIYPTITADEIKCSIKLNRNTDIKLTITDAFGKIIFTEIKRTTSLDSKTIINVNSFSKGIYFIELYNGKEKAIKKFIKI